MNLHRLQRPLAWLAVVAAIGMFLVLVMGSLVTNTGSAQGCGAQWPLCQGKFIPEMAAATAIEFSHRAVTGVETMLVLVVAAGTLLLYRRRREAQVLVPLMLGFLFLQAALGALAVMYPEAPAILALHFGISLISFASVVLTAAFLLSIRTGTTGMPPRDRPVSTRLRWLVWGSLLYTYVVVYLGAYVEHVHANAACLDWPLCNGQVFPGLQGDVGVQFIHRAAAGLLALIVLGLWLQARRERAIRPDLYFGATAALLAMLAQIWSGAVVVLGRFELFTLLSHAGLVALLFASLCYMAFELMPQSRYLPRQPQRPTAAQPDRVPAAAE